jgi:recombination protein RecT
MASSVARSNGQLTIKEYISAPQVIAKMREMLQTPEAVRQFTTAVISIAGSDALLADAEPRSLFNAALTAASLNLPINKNLGFAHIIGYKNNKKGGVVEAQFQLGARGFKELAQRSGRYKVIHEGDVREGEVKGRNRLTGEVEWSWNDNDAERAKLPVIGYFSYFKLDNGFGSTLYWTVEDVRAHAKQYSQAYKSGYGPWKDNFDAMAKKTVMKLNISKNGPLDINLQRAVETDQAVIYDDKIEYIDGEELLSEKATEDKKADIIAAKKPKTTDKSQDEMAQEVADFMSDDGNDT